MKKKKICKSNKDIGIGIIKINSDCKGVSDNSEEKDFEFIKREKVSLLQADTE